ncbi:unnamed protein product [Hydatigera taeniaeformis]|uniref:Protein tweety homolog n=1 Tax=Hydatigena taeniaeformis TaxID=6205 RepID=A0A0R3WI50_HYDTA|nr:unnamed protein product [Hydatigera taeniaeformis]
MIELSVMSFVSIIFDYILRCINGGFLNVFFTPEYDTASKQTTYHFGMNNSRLMEYVKGVLMISGDELPLEVLKSFPVSIGGGEEGVKEARANPNREVIFVIGPVVAAILMLIAIIGLIFINFCKFCKECCHCCKGKKRKSGKKSKASKEAPKTTPVEANGAEDSGKSRDGPPNDRQFDNGYDGYAFYGQRDGSDSDSDDSDDEPKGFVENVVNFFTFNKTTAVGDIIEERQEEIMDKVEEVAQRSEFVHKHQGWFCCGCHLFTFILAIAYVIGLVICVVVYIMAARQVTEVMGQPSSDANIQKNEVIDWLGNKSSYYNLAGTVSFVIRQTIVLLEESSTNLIDTMNTTLDDVKGKIEITVQQGTTELFHEIIVVTEIGKVFDETTKLSTRFAGLEKSADFVDQNCESTIKEATELDKSFAQCHEEIKKTCEQPNKCHIKEASTKIIFCASFLCDEWKILSLNFNEKAFKCPQGPNGVEIVATRFQDVAKTLENLQKELDAMPDKMTSEIVSKMDFSTALNDLQTQLDGSLGSVKQQLEIVESTVPEYIDKARPYVSPPLYAIAVVMAIIALIFFACLLLFIVEAFYLRLFSPTGKAPSERDSLSLLPPSLLTVAEVSRTKWRSHVCGGCRFLTCSILFILLIALSLVAAVILVVSSIMAVELCPYAYKERGINQTDYILNSIVTEKWPQQQGEFLDLSPPRNVLYALSVVCVPTAQSDPKLLPSVGINRIANLVKFADRDDFKKRISDIIDEMAKGISKAIPTELIPNLESMKPHVNILRSALQAYNAENAVKELEKFTKVDMEQLNKLVDSVNKEQSLNQVALKLKSTVEKFRNERGKIMELQNGYQGIASESTLPDDLLTYINDAVKTVEGLQNDANLNNTLQIKIKPKLMELMKAILQAVTDALNGLVTKVLPCANMHYIFEALVASGCASSGLVPRLFGWALALTLVTLFAFLSFVGLFNLWCIQSHQIKRFYGT